MESTVTQQPFLISDPSSLTTIQLLREIQNLKELVFTRMDGIDHGIEIAHQDLVRVPTDVQKQVGGLKELHEAKFMDVFKETHLIQGVLETRLDGMDKAIRLLQDNADKFPFRTDEKIAALSNLHDEKFTSIQVQFKERDTRTEQTSKDSKVAVDAALQAAKEAVNAQQLANQQAAAKSESNFTKQIDQMNIIIQQGNNALGGNINDLKERMTKIESSAQGGKEEVTTRQAATSSIGGLISMIIGAILGLTGLALTIYNMVR